MYNLQIYKGEVMKLIRIKNIYKKLVLIPFIVSLISPLEASINSKIIKEQIDQSKFEQAINQINNSITSEENNPLNYLYRGIINLHLANFYWENNDFEKTLEPNQNAINDFNKALEIYSQTSSSEIYPKEYLHIIYANKGHALYSFAFNFTRKEKKKAKEIFKQSIDAFSNYIELAPSASDSNIDLTKITPPSFYYRVLFDEGNYEYSRSQAFLDRAIVNSYVGLKKSKSFCKDLKESKNLGNVQAKELVRLNC